MLYSKKDIDKTYFNAKIAECFAFIGKNEKIFSNLSTVNMDMPQVISSNIPSDFEIIPNKKFVQDIQNKFGATVNWCSTDNKNYYYYFDFISEGNAYLMLEGINNFDTHVKRDINMVFYINNLYFFTGLQASIDKNYTWSLTTKAWTKIINKWLFEPINLSHKIPSKIIENSNPSTVEDILRLINKWLTTSFLPARKLSIELFNKLNTK